MKATEDADGLVRAAAAALIPAAVAAAVRSQHKMSAAAVALLGKLAGGPTALRPIPTSQ